MCAEYELIKLRKAHAAAECAEWEEVLQQDVDDCQQQQEARQTGAPQEAAPMLCIEAAAEEQCTAEAATATVPAPAAILVPSLVARRESSGAMTVHVAAHRAPALPAPSQPAPKTASFAAAAVHVAAHTAPAIPAPSQPATKTRRGKKPVSITKGLSKAWSKGLAKLFSVRCMRCPRVSP